MISPEKRSFIAVSTMLALTACASGGGYSRYPTGGSYGYNTASAGQNGHTSNTEQATRAGFRTWRDSDPQYRLLPGDQLDIIVYSAPELSRLLLVGPDGRVQMPLAPPVMAANLTIEQLKMRLRTALSNQLVDPSVEITPRTFGSQRIFVGGEVGQPGMFELPGQIGVMEAVMMAGGLRTTAKTGKIILIRRHPDGGPMMKTVDLKSVLHKGARGDLMALRRGDVVFVPRSGIANINLFMQQYIRDALPINFSVSYYPGNSSSVLPVVSGP